MPEPERNSVGGIKGRRGKRASLGVVDDTFVASYTSTPAGAPGNGSKSVGGPNALKEVTLSQARNKALARLGASTDHGSSGMLSEPSKGPIKLLPQMFRDPEVESEYRHTAFLMHRPFLAWTFCLFGIMYLTVMVSGIIWDAGLDETQAPSVGAIAASAALRGVAGLAALLAAFAVLTDALSHESAYMCALLALVLLWAAPQIAQRLRGYLHECPEILLLYLAVYSVLCPAFHMRFVFVTCLGLTLAQVPPRPTADVPPPALTRRAELTRARGRRCCCLRRRASSAPPTSQRPSPTSTCARCSRRSWPTAWASGSRAERSAPTARSSSTRSCFRCVGMRRGRPRRLMALDGA